MLWLTWRQHRKQALFVLIGLAVLAAVLVPTGRRMYRAYESTGLGPCLRGLGTAEWVPVQGHGSCDGAAGRFEAAYSGMVLPAVLLVLLPLLVGMFFGAPLVAREVEHGTHRLVWTQGVTRLRWALVKFGLIVAGTVVAAVAYTMLTSWWLAPLTSTDATAGLFTFPFFDLYGIAPIAYTFFAVALGVFAGSVSRRLLPAMGITLVGFLVSRAAVGMLARPRFQAPLERRFPVATERAPNRALGDWVTSTTIYDGKGNVVAPNTIGICEVSEADICGGADRFNVWTYHPAHRLWLFQWLEAGIFVVAAALLLVLALRLVRRRVT